MPRITKKQTTPVTENKAEAAKPKIKKPASPYILFSKDIRPVIVKENPSLKGKEVVKAIADRWKALDDAEKKKYADLHEVAKKEYAELMKQNSLNQ